VKGHNTTVNIDTDKILYKELCVKGVYSQGREAYEEALRLLTENKYDLGRLKTHRFHLEEAERAILTLGGEIGGEEAICVSLHPDAA
jgi:threonine dehydrogenase-like Zn-dependent dehydrogenase